MGLKLSAKTLAIGLSLGNEAQMPETKDQPSHIPPSGNIRRPLFRRVLLLNLTLSLLLAGAAVAAAFFAVGKAVETSARADIEAEIRILDQYAESYGWFGYAQAIDIRLVAEEKIVDFGAAWNNSKKTLDLNLLPEIGENPSLSVYFLANKDLLPIMGNLAQWPEGLSTKDSWHRFDGADAGASPGVIIAKLQQVDKGRYTLMVGRRLAAYDALYRGFIPAMAIIALAMAAVSAYFTSLFARGFNIRVTALNAVFSEVRGGAVEARVSGPSLKQGDELAQLGAEINAALDEIARLMKGLDAVSQTAAHELNKEVERLQQLASDAGDQEMKAAADALLALLREILELARIKSAPGYDMQLINLGECVDEAITLYKDAYDDKGVSLITAEPSPVSTILGRAPLITNMIANLLNNALKHTPRGGAVSVMIGADDGAVTLSVTDTGAGTDTEDIGELIARGASGPVAGYGFGLRFVQAVAIRHGARVMLKNRKPGLSVAITFPNNLGAAKPERQ